MVLSRCAVGSEAQGEQQAGLQVPIGEYPAPGCLAGVKDSSMNASHRCLLPHRHGNNGRERGREEGECDGAGVWICDGRER